MHTSTWSTFIRIIYLCAELIECRHSFSLAESHTPVSGQRKRGRALIAASSGSDGSKETDDGQPARWKLIGSLVAVATVAALALTYGSDGVQVHHIVSDVRHLSRISRRVHLQ